MAATSPACTVQPRPEGVTITLHPLGAWRGSKGLMLGAVITCAILTVISLTFAHIALYGTVTNRHGQPAPRWLPFAIMGPMWLVGGGLALAAVHMGRKRTVIDVLRPPGQEPALLITESSPLRTRQRSWRRAELSAIRVGDSCITVNDRRLRQLKVVEAGGRTRGMFTERPEEELLQLAEILSVELGLPQAEQVRAKPAPLEQDLP